MLTQIVLWAEKTESETESGLQLVYKLFSTVHVLLNCHLLNPTGSLEQDT